MKYLEFINLFVKTYKMGRVFCMQDECKNCHRLRNAFKGNKKQIRKDIKKRKKGKNKDSTSVRNVSLCFKPI